MIARLVVLLAVGLAACGVGQDPALDSGAGGTTATRDMAATNGDSVSLTVTLSPGAVVPGPGAVGGSGSAVVTLHRGRGEVCVEVTTAGISPVTGAHIHQGRAGQAGDVLLSLQVPTGAATSTPDGAGCVAAAANVLARVRLSPARHYLDIHTDERPDGALRGQLG